MIVVAAADEVGVDTGFVAQNCCGEEAVENCDGNLTVMAAVVDVKD